MLGPMNASPLRIDVHAHLGGLGTDGSGISVSPRFRRSLSMRALLLSQGVTRQELVRADALYVERMAQMVRESGAFDRVVALAMDGYWRDGAIDRDRSPLVVPNDWSRDAARRHPDAFLYGASVSPLRPDALDELDRVASDGAVLIKWLPNIMGFSPGETRFRPFYKKLADLGLPLLCHAGKEYSLPGGRDALGNPEGLRVALDEGAKVIVAHCGTLARCHDTDGTACDGVELIARWCARYDNLFADLSAMTSFLRGWSLRRVLDDERLAPRLLDASDFPVPPISITQLGRAPLGAIARALRVKNLFAKDRALKLAAGMPPEMSTRAHRVLRMVGAAASG